MVCKFYELLTPIDKGGKNENGTTVSPENVPIHLVANLDLSALFCSSKVLKRFAMNLPPPLYLDIIVVRVFLDRGSTKLT